MWSRRTAIRLTVLVCAIGLLGLPAGGAAPGAGHQRGIPRSPITSDLDLSEEFERFYETADLATSSWLTYIREDARSPRDVDRRRERFLLSRSTDRRLTRIARAENRFRRLRAEATGLSSAARSCRVLTLADDHEDLRRRIDRATRTLLLTGRLRQRLDITGDEGTREALETTRRAWKIQRNRVIRLARSIDDRYEVLSDCLARARECVGTVAIGNNIVANPGAENQPGGSSSSDAPQPHAWRVPSGREPGVIVYGTGGFPEAPPGGGANFFMGGANPFASMSQRFDVCRLAELVDGGTVVVALSALIGGYASQSDSARVTLSFVDDAGRTIGDTTLGPVTPADRDNTSRLLERSSRALVPTGTRELVLRVRFERASGISNDGYVDNVSVVLGLAARAA